MNVSADISPVIAIDIDAQIAAVADEIRLRCHVYAGWVRRGSMKQDIADARINAMRAVMCTLVRVRDEQAAKVQPSLLP